MSLDKTKDEVAKRLAAIKKLGKAATKEQLDAAKLVEAAQKKLEDYVKTRDDLNKRIKASKTLEKDYADFKKVFSAFLADAAKLATTINKVKPDTSGRDLFMMASYLSSIGSSGVDDYP